jgi:hypothetical protein
METTKLYEMPGCISCRLKFTLGKAKPFEAFFDGGIPDKGYPAVWMAQSIGQQLAIENSMMFKIGKIRVAKNRKGGIRVTKGIVSDVAPAPEAPATMEEAAAISEAKSFPEVSSIVEAVAILKGDYGVPASRLKSEASVLRVAAEKNVSFPNLKN